MQDNLFESLGAHDGYRVIRRQSALCMQLFVGVRLDHDLVSIVTDNNPTGSDMVVYTIDMPEFSNGALGRFARYADVLASLVRYFNAGGEWADLKEFIACVERAIPGPLTFEGWIYFDGYFDTEGSYNHIWRKQDADLFTQWVVGQFVETNLTFSQLEMAQEMAQADELPLVFEEETTEDVVESSVIGASQPPADIS